MTSDNGATPRRPPTSHLTRIEDCRNARVFDNPAPKCPHDLMWRESDHALAPEEIRKLQCPVEACAATEYFPHDGEHLVIRTYRLLRDREPLQKLIIQLAGGTNAAERVAMGVKDAETGQVLRELLAGGVEDWGWTGADCRASTCVTDHAAPLPTPAEDWDAVWAHLEMSELMWIANALVAGGDPRAAAVAAGNG